MSIEYLYVREKKQAVPVRKQTWFARVKSWVLHFFRS